MRFSHLSILCVSTTFLLHDIDFAIPVNCQTFCNVISDLVTDKPVTKSLITLQNVWQLTGIAKSISCNRNV
ncbi:hypothetical protein, partial [Oenococcus oeni]|uniref:hypothetical protein n=1 Tax=Oenococcus oeni TaxID=1247 RepID=UPI001C5B19BC